MALSVSPLRLRRLVTSNPQTRRDISSNTCMISKASWHRPRFQHAVAAPVAVPKRVCCQRRPFSTASSASDAKTAVRDRIVVAGMHFFAYHGVNPEEQVMGQKFEVDVEMGVDLRPSGQSDDLAKTVDYRRVVGLCRRIFEGNPVKLIECLAERIAQETLDTCPTVRDVRVAVRKPHVAIPDLSHVGVEIHRSRPQ